uniref:Uncharacterized protein n=1 Tax=Globodera rostochiensis TaxID=31243 RepID=A0A914H1M6_GLORO
MSLVNVEEECTFLRQRCTDFETQFGRQRDDFDALLRKYNEGRECACTTANGRRCFRGSCAGRFVGQRVDPFCIVGHGSLRVLVTVFFSFSLLSPSSGLSIVDGISNSTTTQRQQPRQMLAMDNPNSSKMLVLTTVGMWQMVDRMRCRLQLKRPQLWNNGLKQFRAKKFA